MLFRRELIELANCASLGATGRASFGFAKIFGLHGTAGCPSRLLKRSIPSELWRTISGTSAESIAFILNAQPGLAVPQGLFSSLLEAEEGGGHEAEDKDDERQESGEPARGIEG